MAVQLSSVLVANRGEIAVRIMRTLATLDVNAVAVYSRADAGSLHVRTAPIAVALESVAEPTDATGGYLSIRALIDIAMAYGCDAVHPGYGFLAENADFARACAAAGLVFIGPGADAIEALGDKSAAREVATRAGVPVVPGAQVAADAAANEMANGIGYPVLVKPVAGGGGKGMHVAADGQELIAVLPRARREAAAAFGDDRLIIERYLPRARHIEVQVLADAFGDVRAVGDRECTMQRRHQKVIEEAPAPNLLDAVREAIHSAAVAVVREVGYLNAGTVEFVVSAEDSTEFYFLEVNTRLQVEHPVTEEVLGIDLVKCQLRIAEGASLASLEIPEQTHGHAFEARVYAEDADRGFLPTGGRIAHWRVPALPGLRVDAAVASNDVVGSAYDPMIAKVIVHAETREQARRALVNALEDTAVLGVVTNTAFLVDLLGTDEVSSAQMDTRFIERFVESRTLTTPTTLHIALWATTRANAAEAASLLRPLSPAWKSADSWRLTGAGKQLWRGSIEGTAVTAHTHHTSEGLMVSVVQDDVQHQHLVAQTHESDGHFTATVDGESVSWDAARASDSDGEHWWLSMCGRAWVIDSRQQLRSARVAGSQDPQVRSPMPGTVVRIDVAVGDSVEAGQQLIGVEAMKMEHALVAPHAGTVTSVTCQVGAHVKLREVLITVELST